MSDESNALVPATLADDQLLAVADAAEKRIGAVNRIKGLALRVTNHQDWTDQGGKPYLKVSGSEKVARLFGISWRLDEPTKEEHEDGHYSYTINGYFNMGAAEIEVMGTRSSKDPFFSHKGKVPISEIDRNDVKKGAITNCIGNGITRLLGIRNLTWDEVRNGGVNQSQVSKVEYKTEKKPEGAAPAARVEGEDRVEGACKAASMEPQMATHEQINDAPPSPPPFTWRIGKHKGKPITEVPTDYLAWALSTITKPELQDCQDAARMEIDRRQAQDVMQFEEGR